VITSASDVSRALGAKVASEVASMTGTGRPMCRFILASSNVGRPGSVVAVIDTASSMDAFRFAQAGYADAAAVPGVGDRAYYSPSLCVLTLMKGTALVTVQAALVEVPGAAPPLPNVLKSDLIALGQIVDAQL
jgi:hypothetical protein